jgi:hypothetical protein
LAAPKSEEPASPSTTPAVKRASVTVEDAGGQRAGAISGREARKLLA